MFGIEKKITDGIRRYYFIIFGVFAFIAGLKLRKMGLVLDFYNYYIPYMC